MKFRVPVPGLVALIGLALLDLATTLWWHANGMMTELNPLMRPLLEKNEWLFSGVKLATIVALAIAIVLYAKKNLAFCRRVCAVGAGAYISIWTAGVILGALT